MERCAAVHVQDGFALRGKWRETLMPDAKQLRVELTDAAMNAVIDQGFDPTFGARPLKRFLQSKVETLIARRIIAANVRPGDTLPVDADDAGRLLVTV